jgi:hypothetical protein
VIDRYEGWRTLNEEHFLFEERALWLKQNSKREHRNVRTRWQILRSSWKWMGGLSRIESVVSHVKTAKGITRSFRSKYSAIHQILSRKWIKISLFSCFLKRKKNVVPCQQNFRRNQARNNLKMLTAWPGNVFRLLPLATERTPSMRSAISIAELIVCLVSLGPGRFASKKVQILKCIADSEDGPADEHNCDTMEKTNSYWLCIGVLPRIDVGWIFERQWVGCRNPRIANHLFTWNNTKILENAW